MTLETVEAVVLASRPYGESHRIVTLLTQKFGVMTAMAYGAGKQPGPLAAGTGMLTRGLFLVRRRDQGLADLLQAETRSLYPRTRADILRSAYAQAALELATVLGRQSEAFQGAQLYHEVAGALERLEQGAPIRLTMAHLFARVPELAGLSVAASRCAVCDRPLEGASGVRFVPPAGGLVCGDCTGHTDAVSADWSGAAVRTLAAMTATPVADGVAMDGVTAMAETDAERLLLRTLAAYLAEFGGVVLKSWQVITALDP